MKWIRFSDILQPTQYREKVGPLNLGDAPGYDVTVAPLDLSFQASPHEGGYRLEGGFDYLVTAPCARCLASVNLPGHADFDLLFRPAHLAPPPEEEVVVDVFADGSQVIYYEEDTLQLADFVSQQIYLEIPEKVLCNDDCKGLCPRCGADLNSGACPCPPEGDTRWAELSQFVRQEKES